jgi:hypothetical protein
MNNDHLPPSAGPRVAIAVRDGTLSDGSVLCLGFGSEEVVKRLRCPC